MAARKWKTLHFPPFLVYGISHSLYSCATEEIQLRLLLDGREPPGLYDIQILVCNICGPCTRTFCVLSYMCYVLGVISTMCRLY